MMLRQRLHLPAFVKSICACQKQKASCYGSTGIRTRIHRLRVCSSSHWHILPIFVPHQGLEPWTPCLRGRYSNQIELVRHKRKFLILCRSYLQTPETHLFEFTEMTNNYPCFWQVKVVADHSTPDRDRTCIFSSNYDYKIRSLARLLVYISDHGGIRTHEKPERQSGGMDHYPTRPN